MEFHWNYFISYHIITIRGKVMFCKQGTNKAVKVLLIDLKLLQNAGVLVTIQ